MLESCAFRRIEVRVFLYWGCKPETPIFSVKRTTPALARVDAKQLFSVTGGYRALNECS